MWTVCCWVAGVVWLAVIVIIAHSTWRGWTRPVPSDLVVLEAELAEARAIARARKILR